MTGHSEFINGQRYHRQMILPGFGMEAQQKLGETRILVVGAGGLGCPALQYLAGAGIGTLGIIDHDQVSLDNLHRQPLFTSADIGRYKAEAAAERLLALNDEIRPLAWNERLTPGLCLDLFPSFDIILDCSDNFPTRYMINDACLLLGIPLILGAVSQFAGQVILFDSKQEPCLSYRDLFPQAPGPGEVRNCAEAGVLGPLPAIIGAMQAAEAIKWITGVGETLWNKLLTYDLLRQEVFVMQCTRREGAREQAPPDVISFLQMDYDDHCGTLHEDYEIGVEAFDEMRTSGKVCVVDVRETGEAPPVTAFEHLAIPLKELPQRLSELNADTIVFFCRSGQRSLMAAQQASTGLGSGTKCYSLRGGILQWKQFHNMKTHV